MDLGDGFFNFYWVMLLITGVLMLGLGTSGFGGATKGVRAVNIVVAILFLGYGLYLGLFFNGGTYFISFKAFLLPVVLIANGIRGAAERSKKRRQVQNMPMQPGPTPGYPQQPGYPPVSPWQNAAPQPGAMPQPGGAPQPGYPQPGYPQPGYPQPGYPQPGYPQPPAGQQAVPPQGYPQQGIPQPGYAPTPTWQPAPPQAPTPPSTPPEPSGPTLTSDDVLGR